MNVHDLRQFVEIIDQGSISKAAERLNVSQPALTKRVRNLETALDARLLVRSNTGVIATESGRSLYAHARAVIAEVEHAEAEIRRINGGERGNLRIGVLPSVSSELFAQAIARLTAKDPGLHIHITESPNYELMPALRRREYDFIVAIADRFEPDPAVRHRIILRDKLRIIARADHPLAELNTVTCADLVKYPWAHPVVGTTHRPILAQLFKGSGIEPPQAHIECASVQFMTTLIANSDALGLMPAHTIRTELRTNVLCCLPIVSDDFHRTIGIYYNANRPLSPAARTVIREIERSCIMIAAEA